MFGRTRSGPLTTRAIGRVQGGGLVLSLLLLALFRCDAFAADPGFRDVRFAQGRADGAAVELIAGGQQYEKMLK